MASQPAGMLTRDDLNDTDGRVLDVLREGRVTPQYVADQLDVSRTYASERLKRLVEHDHVKKLASGLYELNSDPRADSLDFDSVRVNLAIQDSRLSGVITHHSELTLEELDMPPRDRDTLLLQTIDNAGQAAVKAWSEGLQEDSDV